MSPKCLHCNHELPVDVPLATCPFCLKRLSGGVQSGDEKRTLELEVQSPGLGQAAGDTERTLPVAGSVPNNSPPSSVVFGKTYVPEDLEVHFVGGSASETLEAIVDADQAKSTFNTPRPESSEKHVKQTERSGSTGGTGGTLVFPDQRAEPVDADRVQTLAGDELEAAGRNDNQDTLAHGEHALPERGETRLTDHHGSQGKNPLSQAGSSDTNGSSKSRSDQVRRRWANAAGESANPMHTVKADTRDSHTTDSLDLPVKLRNVAFQPVPIDGNADYQLIQKLGEGAMGLIHKAKQHSIDRFVAFKTIKKDVGKQSPETRRKFLREAQITGGLDHPNIVPIHDLGVSEDGALFYSMKLVEGTPWQQVIVRKSRDENLEILLKVCDAVAFAHSRDVIHRDLKPENVMLGQFGEVLVMDWGLAISQRKDRDRKFSLGGTPAYMAPEMARHDVKQIGDASDIYLLGAMLYQIVVGYPPHPGKTVTECVQLAGKNVIIPPPDPDDELMKIALRAMAMQPQQRHRTVSELQQAIRGYRRNAESVALAQRAEIAFEEALQQQNYQQFSKALFGFTDALEIWPDNVAAQAGADRARLEYGRCACNRGDFDLALQLLREDVEDEKPLYQQALQGKRDAAQRERRIRRLRTSVLTVVSVALLGALGFLGVLEKNRRDLARSNEDLQIETVQKIAALEAEAGARALAEKKQAEAEAAQKIADAEAINAAEQRRLADIEAKNARVAEAEAKKARDEALAANDAEKMATQLATEARDDAVKAKEEAEQARKDVLVQNRLNAFKNYPAKLNLASVRVRRQQDVSRSGELLDEIQELERSMTESFDPTHPESTTPLMRNWAYRRVELLSNKDLPRLLLDARATCVSAAVASSRLAIGTDSGLIAVVTVGENGLEIVHQKQDPGNASIRAIALAPRGDAIAYSSGNQTYYWQLHEDKRMQLPDKGNINGDIIRFTSPLPYLVVGSGTRLRLWKTDENGKPLSSEDPGFYPGFQSGDIRMISTVPKQPNLLACLVVQNSGKLQQQLRLFEPALKKPPVSLNLPAEIAEVQHLEFVAPNRLVIGTADGELLPLQFDSGQISGRLNALPPLQTDVHTTAVQTFAVSPDQSWMISVGKDSPAIQLWKSDVMDSESTWRYAWPLLGHGVEQVIAVDFFDAGKRAVSVDQAGRCILWDTEHISMRNRMANRLNFELPVASGVSGSNASQPELAVTINKLGVLDRWPLSECDDIRPLNSRRWDYNGHPPEAKLWDAALTPDGRLLITSATIPKGDPLESSSRQFCLWQVDSRTMLARWGDDVAGDPTVAISSDGRNVVIGGRQTQVVTFDAAWKPSAPVQITDSSDVQPGAFSLAIRPNPAEAALAGRGGSVRTAELKPPHRVLNKHDDGSTEREVRRAVWSPDGQYLFLLLDQGAIHALRWPGKIGKSGRAISGIKSEIRNHRDVDAMVEMQADGKPTLQLALRDVDARQNRITQFYTFDLEPTGGLLNERPREEAISNHHWLVPHGSAGASRRVSQTELTDHGLDKIHLLRSDSTGKRLVAFDQSGDFCVIDVEQGQSKNQWVRRTETLDASLSPTSDGLWKAVTVNRHADIWFAMPSGLDPQGEVSWRPLEHTYQKIDQLALSPHGDKLAVIGKFQDQQTEVGVWQFSGNTASNKGRLAGVQAIAWHPDADKLVAWTPASRDAAGIVLRPGKLLRQPLGGKAELLAYPSELDESGRTVKRLAFYRESFADPKLAPRWHVVIQVDLQRLSGPEQGGAAGRSEIFLVPFDQQNHRVNDQGIAEPDFIRLPPLEAVTAITASPTENLLAIGSQSGTISLWLMTPSLDKKEAFEIYDFDDHRGSPIRSLAFGADGNTLISVDSRGRQYAWLSTTRTSSP